jgi:predicted Zn finger-like uncharacterized protein
MTRFGHGDIPPSQIVLVNDTKCWDCLTWGYTVQPYELGLNDATVRCPKCGRVTWAISGVNVPLHATINSRLPMSDDPQLRQLESRIKDMIEGTYSEDDRARARRRR